MSNPWRVSVLVSFVLTCGGNDDLPSDGGATDPPPPPPPQAVDCTHRGAGRDLRVGPGLEHASLADVPWESLAPGDTVRIHWRPEPYREKAIVATSGTAAQPIRICGVAGPNGELPVLSGDGAITRRDLGTIFGEHSSYSMQQTALLVIWDPDYGEHVEHVHVEGLHFTSTIRAPWHLGDVNQFVDWDGTTRPWANAAAGVRIQRARHLVLRGNTFTHLAVGVYAISQDFGESFMIRDVLVEGNRFEHNALVDDYNKHQAYLQGTGWVIQFNYFGSPTPGSWGNDLKMRSAGDVIRHNYFENGAHAIDLVDIEDFVGVVMPWRYARLRTTLGDGERAVSDPLQAADWAAYRASYVYGNVFRLVGADAWADPIHFGYDNSPYDRRPGTLWFYFNTLVYQTDYTDVSTVRLFSCCSDFADSYYGDEARLVDGALHYVAPPPDGGATVDWGPMLATSAETFPRMRASNNVIVLASFTAGAARSDFELTRWRVDQLELGRNWISTGWNVQDRDQSAPVAGYGNSVIPDEVAYPGGNAGHHVTGAGNLREGEAVPIDLRTMAPLAGGPLVGAAEPLPAEIPASLRPTHQLRLDLAAGRVAVEPRPGLTTLGAIE